MKANFEDNLIFSNNIVGRTRSHQKNLATPGVFLPFAVYDSLAEKACKHISTSDLSVCLSAIGLSI